MSAPAARIRYRKLPGHLRGIFRGASVWQGGDHLLAVRNVRVREEYKRFHLRDIQAIAVADAPRFHISTRMVLIGILWLVAYIVLPRYIPWATTVLWTTAALLVCVWLYVSAAESCRCRIYTAVSRDDLPSIYRKWTARKFLAEVEPRIAEAQGVISGDWAEAAEDRTVGPPLAPGTDTATAVVQARSAPTRNWATDLLLVTWFAIAATNAGLLTRPGRGLLWATWIFQFVEMAAAVTVFVYYHRRALRSAMQKLAIAGLVVEGLFFYVRPVTMGIMAGINANKGGPPPGDMTSPYAALQLSPLVREIDIGAHVLLALVGLAIVLWAPEDRS